jgi:hypothetical protein
VSWRNPCQARTAEPAGQEEQLGAFGLILNTIVLYNTISAQRAVDHLKAVDRSDILPGLASSASTLPSASTLFPWSGNANGTGQPSAQVSPMPIHSERLSSIPAKRAPHPPCVRYAALEKLPRFVAPMLVSAGPAIEADRALEVE